jgi:hypothetical protein
MIIELWRKMVATEYSGCSCAICGNDFYRGNVFAVAAGDQGEELGEMCPVCLEHLNRRKRDAEDPTLDNWPARGWPTPQDLEQARRRYPEPMFETEDDLLAAAEDRAADAEIYEASFVWKMKREKVPR